MRVKSWRQDIDKQTTLRSFSSLLSKTKTHKENTMTKYVLLSTVLLAFIVTPQLAYANCQIVTIFNPDGTMTSCTVCKMGPTTTVNCM